MDAYFRKVKGDIFTADDEATSEWAKGLPIGTVLRGEFKKPANYKFFKKMHALCRLCFDYFGEGLANQEPLKYRGVEVQKSYDMFREELTILAGYYTTGYSLNGRGFRLIADSWSFGRMDEETREKMFSALIDVALKQIFKMTIDEQLLRKMVDDTLGFDG